MIRFWLITFEVDPSEPDLPPGPILDPLARRLAIEVLQEDQSWAVLFSSADDLDAPQELTCRLGFTNAAERGNKWQARGFPLVDAAIEIDPENGALTVVSPSFRDTASMEYEEPLVRLSGFDFRTASGQLAGTQAGLSVIYAQELRAPDLAQPDLWITRRTARWRPGRRSVIHHGPTNPPEISLNLGSPAARSPSLAPLRSGKITARQAWSGELVPPPGLDQGSGKPEKPMPAAQLYGIPSYCFDEVEVLGFRIDLGAAGSIPDNALSHALARLLEPLNFHLADFEGSRPGIPIPDFHFRAATSTVLIELLRYGRMTAISPPAPLTPDDSQSQHELLVRMLVGRVEEGAAQARMPAAYVPAIFVDNPWSKILGRFVLGFDKRLANFCVRRDGGFARLLPDGRLARQGAASYARTPVPLGDISRVELVDTTGTGARATLLDLDCQSTNHTDPDAFHWVDRVFGFGASMLGGARWRESDFNLPAFARAFARRAIPESFRSLRCVQAAPLADHILTESLDQTWIEGTFVIDDVRFALPLGTATLRLHAAPPDPEPTSAGSSVRTWNLLCQLLGDGQTAELTVRTGSWYRLLCSMRLTVDDSLQLE